MTEFEPDDPALDSSAVLDRFYAENGPINRPGVNAYPRPQLDDPARWPEPLDLPALAAQQPQPPRFVVRDWMPVGYATLLAGHGGVGKSAIGLYLAVCIAMGLPFFGVPTDRRRVLYLSCEDREGVLHWRLSHICAHVGINIADLSGWLDVLDLVGRDCILWDRDPRTGYTLTPAFGQLDHAMQTARAQVLVVDGVSDTFGGNENARTDVKRFVNALLALIPLEGALLLLAHVAKPAASAPSTSEGYSGSTGWHNAVRARLYLRPEVQHDEAERPLRTGNLQLELQKSNLGPVNQTMTFSFDEHAHLFVGRLDVTSTAGGVVDSIRSRTEQAAILKAIAASTDAGLPVPAAMQGPRTAYFVLAGRPEFPDSLMGGGKPQKRRFARHIEALRQIRHLTEASYRRANRHTVATFEVTSEGRAEYVNSQ